MARICHAIFSDPWHRLAGGGQHATHALAETMLDEGHDVSALYSGDVPANAARYRIRSVKSRTAGRYNLDAAAHAWALARLLAASRFDLVVGHSVNAVFFPEVCRRFDVPFVFMFHGSWLPGAALGDTRQLLFHLAHFDYHLVRRALVRAACITVFSEWSRQHVVRMLNVDAGRVHVLTPGLAACWRTAHWRPLRTSRLMHWGRLASGKGVDDLLRALAIVRRAVPDATLTIAGTGELEGDLRRLAIDLDVDAAISWVGRLDPPDIVALAASSDVAVFPTHMESYGFAVAEALAVGMPVVCTHVGALPELTSGGCRAQLVRPRVPQDLADGILRVLQSGDGAERLPAANSFRAHTWHQTAAQLLTAVHVGGRPAPADARAGAVREVQNP